ncbi:MAG: flagellar assembly protein FliH [Pseudazoarcus pumilus]|nr:flagellar assembly protein FliH [Pseudazoarcus pumilus]
MSVTRHQAVGAYQRWTPPAFDGEPEAPAEEAAVEPAEAPAAQAAPEPAEPPVKLPTADEIEAMYEQARRDGEKAGFDEGMKKAQAEAAQLTRLVRSMDSALDQLGGDVAEEIATLAIALARELVGDTLEARPEAVVAVVREALQQVPQGKVRIHLNPEDVKLVRSHLDDQLETGHHHLIEDAAVARGGCRLEAAGCDIDGTLPTRWERVLASIGRSQPAAADDDA